VHRGPKPRPLERPRESPGVRVGPDPVDAARSQRPVSLAQACGPIERGVVLAGKVAAGTLAYVAHKLRAGVSTADIDQWVREDTARRGALPSQLGYKGFPAAVCTSRNEVVCHGIPNPKHILEPGDIVNVDVTSNIDGYHGDTSATFSIGEVSDDARHVVEVCQRALAAGIAAVRHGARLGDIGAAIVEIAEQEGCGVV